MGGPEQLDSGPTRSPGRAVWVLVTALVVLLGVGVVWDQRRSEQTGPPPTPTPTRSSSARLPTSPSPTVSPSPSPPVTFRPGRDGKGRPLAPGLPAGTLYARSTDTLYAVDVRTGATVATSIPTRTANDAVSMVPTGDGVTIRAWDDADGLLVRDGRLPDGLPGRLRTADELLPGPQGRLWVLTRPDDDPFTSTATLVDSRGRRDGPRSTATGNYTSDGAGGLLLLDVGGVWQAYPEPLRRVTGGSLTSVGVHHYQLLECDDRHRCSEFLLDRRDGRRTPLSDRSRSYGGSLISPAGTLMASLGSFADDADPRTTITRLADDEVLHRLPDPPSPASSQPGSIVWLSQRWLVVITGGRIALYDTRDDRVLTPDVPAEDLLQLAWRPS